MGKSLLRYNRAYGAAIIILTKVLLRCMAPESSAFQVSAWWWQISILKLYWPYRTTNL